MSGTMSKEASAVETLKTNVMVTVGGWMRVPESRGAWVPGCGSIDSGVPAKGGNDDLYSVRNRNRRNRFL